MSLIRHGKVVQISAAHYSQSIVQEAYDIVAYDSSRVKVALEVGADYAMRFV